MDSLLSLRPVIAERLAPLALAFGADAAAVAEVLTEAVVRVASSREEGSPLSPVVFLCRDVGELARAVNGAHVLPVGGGRCDPNTTWLALKSCMPLSEGRQWAVYLNLQGERMGFGVFCTDRSPLRATSFESARLLRAGGSPLVGITKLGESIVEVRGPGGAVQYFDFTGAADLATNPARVIQAFVQSVTREVPLELRRQLEAFFYRLGVELMSDVHGSLMAVLAPGAAKPDYLADGLWLEQPVDIGAQVRSYELGRTEESALSLTAFSLLLRRMIGMDGITLFSCDGRLLAYNCFIREQMIGPRARSVIGGARRRAYELLCDEVGRTLLAALYRSRDGASECRLATQLREG